MKPAPQEAVAAYAMRAAEKLRKQQSLCRQVRVSLRTGMFNPAEVKYANGILYQLPYPTDDSRLIIQAVQAGLKQVFREGFSYAKAQVLLLDLYRKNEYTPDLFSPEQPVKTERLMSTLDAINNRWGRGTLQARTHCQDSRVGYAERTALACIHNAVDRPTYS